MINKKQPVLQPTDVSFYRAVRLLECLHPELPRVGYGILPSQDPIRFAQNPFLTFPLAELQGITPYEEGKVQKMYLYFFGLFGPHGPLPPHLTEYARERQRNFADETFVAFVNLFHHRLTSLFYRAWSSCQITLDLDRRDAERFSSYIGAFFGLGTPALAKSDHLPDWAKLFFSGRLAHPSRHAEGLENILREFFGLPVTVTECIGRWLELPPDCRMRLGRSPTTGSLGLNAIVGERIWNCELGFRIVLGPLKLPDYERMLPDGDSFTRLKDWVRLYCGLEYHWDVQLVLDRDEVPTTRVGTPALALGEPVATKRTVGGRLGWTTWAISARPPKDVSDLVLTPGDN